ncbi:MAG: (2Fe-2S)-binding protein [Rhodothermales bacterium]|nr:(2Fe-2S)-binding protein [Rhodothermales bacterium]
MSTIRVDRCLCHSVTFEEMKAAAERHQVSDINKLREVVSFGTGCGLCRPYVREMLRTGEVVFDRLIEPDDRP